MYRIVFVVFVYSMCVSGSGIFHENSKITFYPDSVLESEYFGYSVLLNPYGLIVGAPKATNRERSIASGVVFNCTLQELNSKNVTCQPIMITDKDHYNMRFRKFTPDNVFKDDMWFGATIGAITDGKLLICAPRFTEPYSDKHLLANGVCYVRKNSRDFVVYPLRDMSHQAFRTDGVRREYGEYGQHLSYYAYGQAGMSVKVTGTNQVIIGAPGLLQWAGGIVNYLYSPDDNSPFFSQQTTFNPYFTKDMGPDDYFGYSVESGVFEKYRSMLFIGGAPRAKSGYGQVLVFEPAIREQDALNIRAKLQGPQLFSYFGASLCCLDIDGDGAADLLVGAPNYAKKDGGLPYDQGAVFIYMTKQTNTSFTLEASGSVSGSGESGARFGTTIADLGDVDGDGFRDVAIGAPWENEGSGVVYIYRGYDKGLRSQYTQRIIAEGAGSFGISISKGLDVDRNNCNDLAIGAATSTNVHLYRCVPTVLVHTSIKVPDAMNLPHNATGFTALFCVTLPKKPLWPHVKIDFNAKIIIDPEDNRATISGNSKYEYNVTASPGNVRCDEQTVEVKPTADLSKPISMKFELEPDEIMKNDTETFNNHAARVSEESDLQSTFLIQLVRDCGEDMICTPWLVMTLDALDNPYIPGTDTKLGARLTILNKEEPAYGARVNISLPIIPKRVPSPCSLEGLVMTCDVPAPLLRDEEIVWDIVLDYNLNSSSEANLKVVAELEDSLYYRNISKDLLIDLVLNVVPEASFNVSGKPPQNGTVAISREKLYDAENITYANYIEIMNLGPSDWYNLEVHILFDLVTLSSPIKGCEDDGVVLVCVLSVPANVSISIVLPLRLDLGLYGDTLEQNNTLNTTTSVFLFWKENEPSLGLFSNTTIITTLVLDPTPPIWPLILGIVAGLIFGLLLLALIVYLLYKYGFFSRTRYHERLKDQQETSSDNELDESEGPSTTGNENFNESAKELLFEDSD